MPGFALPVAGGGTRVAPVIGPTGNRGELFAVAVDPAGAKGLPAAEPFIERWQPMEIATSDGSRITINDSEGRFMASLLLITRQQSALDGS